MGNTLKSTENQKICLDKMSAHPVLLVGKCPMSDRYFKLWIYAYRIHTVYIICKHLLTYVYCIYVGTYLMPSNATHTLNVAIADLTIIYYIDNL